MKCIVCNKELEPIFDDMPLQPNNGIMCIAEGNYGSTELDDITDGPMLFHVCDECFRQKRDTHFTETDKRRIQ